MKFCYSFLVFFSFISFLYSYDNDQNNDFTFYVWKYQGGGDWYEGRVGVKNLMSFVNKNTSIKANPTPQIITLESSSLQNCFFLYATGHGVLTTTEQERRYLKDFLLSGGFLYLNDDYGMDVYIRKLLSQLFPDQKAQALPRDHLLFNIFYSFPNGTPKIHKHDGKAPESLAIFYNKRMLVLYTYESDIGDGWAPYQVHKDPEEIRLQALRFGVNVIYYAMTQ